MPPKITDPVAWQQAELLMQPALIRVIDRIRQQLEVSDWKGTYQNEVIWPEGTTEETKKIVAQLVEQLESSPEQTAEIEQVLSKLPTPQPEYYLCLQRKGLPFVKINLWELCYQVCFRNYSPSLAAISSYAAEIDTSLIEAPGEVDWQRLDAKAGDLIEQIFANLPAD